MAASVLINICVCVPLCYIADLSYLSIKPSEKEYLYPPLTYLKPTGDITHTAYDGIKYTIIDVVPFFPS